MGTEEKDRIISTERGQPKQPKCLQYIAYFARLWTLATLIVLWATCITTLQFASGTPFYWAWYLMAASILVTLLELTWIIHMCTCCNEEGCCCRCWAVVMWLDNWKRGIIYLLLTIPIFVNGTKIILGIVSGLCLIVAGILYIVKTFQNGLVYTITETRYVKMSSPPVNVISCHTQTEEETFRYEDFEPNEGYKVYKDGKRHHH